MGHRANFVIIRDNKAKAYEDQWAALDCLSLFATGPHDALAAVLTMRETPALMDWAFAEGGYLLDFDAKIALVFGYPFYDEEWENIGGEAVQQAQAINTAFEQGPREFLAYIAPGWSGWTLGWDARGVDAFAVYLQSRNIHNIDVALPSHPPDIPAAVSWQA